MKSLITKARNVSCLGLFLIVLSCQGVQVKGLEEDTVLGPQSKLAQGELHVLMVAVRFPDAEPSIPLERTRKRVVVDLNDYIKEQSYGRAGVKADFRGWVKLPDSLGQYKVSPYNYQVDRTRVRKLAEDSMTALEKEVDFSQYHHILIIPGVQTMPGKGYGMICYCANPGMLTGVRRDPQFVTLRSKGGKEFQGGVFVGAENSHLGMFAHDFFHALGGVYEKKRLVPCLYDFDRQSDSSRTPSPEHHAVYMGPYDIMSEHFVKREDPPPGLSSFTKIRLGWITAQEAIQVQPGETAMAFLSHLGKRGEKLIAKIPLKDGQYYLVENRQAVGYDRVLPDFGLLVLKVNPDAKEGQGTVQIMKANPKAHHFSQATYRLDLKNRNIFIDGRNKLAIIPIWTEGENLGVLITSAERGPAALEAALSIQSLRNRYPEPRDREKEQAVQESLTLFKKFNFKGAAEMAERGLN